MLNILILSLSVTLGLQAADEWPVFQKNIEKKTNKISAYLPKGEIQFNYQSSDRVEGSCKGASKIDSGTVEKESFEIEVNCDGVGWEKKTKAFRKKKKVMIGKLDTYFSSKRSANMNVPNFETKEEIFVDKDEATSFIIKFRSIQGRGKEAEREIGTISYSVEDPG